MYTYGVNVLQRKNTYCHTKIQYTDYLYVYIRCQCVATKKYILSYKNSIYGLFVCIHTVSMCCNEKYSVVFVKLFST
jgi:hypothetical protein